ncbi:carbon-nitrogen hydrolase [Aspergillus californicus]
MSVRRQWKAAISQAEPLWFDLEEAVNRTIELIEEAAQNDASLIAFSEIWIPGYPNFLWGGTYSENIPLVQKYIKNSMSAHGPEMLRIRQAAAQNSIHVVLGFSERTASTSLYMAQVLIDDHGDVLLHRRKIKPTHLERTMFGDSTGDSLTTVADTKLGRIGMLNCWEHLQPLLKYHTYAQNEQVHIAAWPYNNESRGNEPWSVCNEANEVVASRMYAIEGGSFVLVTNQSVSEAGMKKNTEGHAANSQSFACGGAGGGAAAVFAPDGRQLTAPSDPTLDGLIYCDIDLDMIDAAKTLADPVGHYSRPDLLRLVVDSQPKHFEERADGTPPPTLTSLFKPLGETVAEFENRRNAGTA